MCIRILVADDHRLVREGIISLLREEADMEVVGQASNGRQAVELAAKLTPDVVILDIAMPDLNGVDAARAIFSRLPKVRIIALTVHAEQRFVVNMLRAGATGYLPKSSAFDELTRAIRCVHSGKTYLSPIVAGPVLKDLLERMGKEDAVPVSVLSLREREVLQLVAEGKASKEVAKALHISINTVIRHRQHVMDKLGVHGVAALTKYAIREGLCGLEW